MINPSGLYTRVDTGAIVNEKHYKAVVALIKVIYRLSVVNEDQAMDVITKFQALFV